MQTKLLYDIKDNYGENLLRERGVKNIQSFLHPGFEDFEPPSFLDNIGKAADIYLNALKKEKTHIALIVDCDVDGYTSATIIYQYTKIIAKLFNCEPLIDFFIHEGKQHGLQDLWEEVSSQSYDLLIIPDAGSNDGQYIKELDIPTIVLDHHLIETEEKDYLDINSLPTAALVNNQSSEKCLNKNLSGAGVVYKFIWYCDSLLEIKEKDNFIDLAALGICADMMSGLEVENQAFWKYGFSNLKNPFFKAIVEKQAYSITGETAPTEETIINCLNPITVAFYVVPMINAMNRVGTMEEKRRMFLAFVDGKRLVPSNKRGAKGELTELCIESVRECTNARSHQNKDKEKITEKLEMKIFKQDLLENKILFIRLEDDDVFPAELNGLVATELAQKYKRPTIVARLNDQGFIRGSARGIDESKMESFKQFLNDTNLFEYTRGHDMAFGISISNNKLMDFHKIANNQLADYDFGNSYYKVEFEREGNDNSITNIIKDLDRYKNTWSQKNQEPLISVQNIKINTNDIMIMGRLKNTIKIQYNGVSYLKFFAKDLIEELESYRGDITINIIGTGKINKWMNRETPQIIIKELEIQK